jgi:peptidoglycan/LPS O-acetylase OafA/YrhL
VTERDRIQRERQLTGDGPRVGLAAFDPHDPEATLRPVEPVRLPPPTRGGAKALMWPLRLVAVWLVNLMALALAGLIVTNVGADDPFAYVGWAALFGLVNAFGRPPARFGRGRRAVVVSAALLLAVNVVTVWLMTVLAPPSHGPDLAGIAKAAAVMLFANLPLRLLLRRRIPSPPGGIPSPPEGEGQGGGDS